MPCLREVIKVGILSTMTLVLPCSWTLLIHYNHCGFSKLSTAQCDAEWNKSNDHSLKNPSQIARQLPQEETRFSKPQRQHLTQEAMSSVDKDKKLIDLWSWLRHLKKVVLTKQQIWSSMVWSHVHYLQKKKNLPTTKSLHFSRKEVEVIDFCGS